MNVIAAVKRKEESEKKSSLPEISGIGSQLDTQQKYHIHSFTYAFIQFISIDRTQS
jgi:hypothetical protein